MSRPKRRALALSEEKKALLERLLREEGLDAPAAARIERRADPGAPAPLSAGQRRIWLLERLLAGEPVYHVPAPVHLVGPLDVEALAEAWSDVVRRHEVLRTRFVALDDEPVQVVEAAPDTALPLEDLGAEAPAWDEVLRLVDAEYRRPFDLEAGPPVRGRLWRLGPEEHVLLLTFHHAVSDGTTIAIVFDELEALYRARLHGEAPSLAEPPLQAADHAVWQQGWLEGEAARRELAHWRARLAGEPPDLELPCDRPRPARPTHAGVWLERELDPALAAAVEALARAHGATPYLVHLAAFQALLARLSGQTDVLVGSPVATRTRTELERLPGFFVNTVCLLASLADDPTFEALLERTRADALDAFANQDVPFEEVLAAVRPAGGAGGAAGTAPFRVMFDHRRLQLHGPRLEGLRESRFLGETEVHSGTAKVDLALYTETREGRPFAALELSTDLFDPETGEAFLARFERLLAAAVAAPGTRVSELPLLSSDEERALAAWNDTAVPYPDASTVHAELARVAAARPEAVALVWEGGELTHGELDRRANRLARHLIGCGVAPGDLVGLSLERGPDLVVALLAVLKAGGAYVPLDPTYPRERLAAMLADCGAHVLVTQAALVGELPTEGVRLVLVDGEAAAIAARPATDPETLVPARSTAYVIYTSGSTGEPKGVPVPHQGVLRLVFGPDWLELDAGTRIVQLAPISFDASVLDVWGALLHGGSVVLHPGRVPRPDVLAELVERHDVNALFLTTALFNALVDEAPAVFERVRQVATGGEAMSAAHVRRVQAVRPDLRITNCYGPTEASVIATCHVVPSPLPGDATQVPIGRPIANTTAHVLDARLRPVPVGVPGELCVGGPGVALGYLNRPELTAERFVPDPSSSDPEARLYRTGDRVRWRRDGELEYLGRLDDQVKIRGHRIEPGEVAARLEALPGVARAACDVRTDRSGERVLVGYAVPEAGSDLRGDALRAELAERLPEYLLPRAVLVLEALPTTAGGKLDRAALPDPEEPEAVEAPAMASPTEELVLQHWCDVLGIAAAGPRDDFFALGGHSLRATVLLSRVRRDLGVDVPLDRFFRDPTIAGLAAAVEDGRRTGAVERPPLERRAPVARGPLSFNQKGLFFLQRLAPDSAFYSVPVRIELRGPVEVDLLQRSLAEVVRRHDSLRTTFVTTEEGPQAVVGDALVGLPVHDASDQAPEGAAATLARRAAELARSAFDLEEGPLLKVALVRTAPDVAHLLVNVHHIVFDGWSMDVLCRELARLYAAYAAGEESPLPEPPIQYADFVAWQRSWLRGPRWEAELAFWRERLADAPRLLELPTDHPRPDVAAWRGRSERRPLPRFLTDRLRAACRAHGATPFMVLLAATQVVLSRYARQTDFVVGTPVSGRTAPEAEHAIGLFLNMVALRARLGDDPTFAELVRRVRAAVLEAHAHQDFPFDALVEELAPERDLRTTPIYQVLFSLRHPGRALEAGDVRLLPPAEVPTGTVKTDLSITFDDDGADLVLDLTYDEALFEAATIERLGRHVEALLESAVAGPETPISRLELLSSDERRTLLVDWNGATPEYPERSLAEVFEERVRETPDAIAVTFRDAALTYRELNRRANQVAHFLVKRGVRADTCVVTCLDRSLDLIVCILGILKAGGAYVPLDPSYPEERLAFMLADARAPVLLVHRALADALPPHDLDAVVLEDAWETIERERTNDPAPRATADSLAYVLYTSGSTGRPKGVAVPQRGVLRLVFGTDFARLGPDVTILQLAPISFDASTFEIWGALLRRGRLVVYPERVPTTQRLGQVLRDNEVTTLWLTAALFNHVVDEDVSVLAGLREVLTGGEALSVPHVQRAYAALPSTVQLVNGYGPTESTTFACCHRIPRELPPDLRSIPIGRPIANTRVYVVDDGLRLVPPGLPGELLIGGDGLAREYLRRPELTAERFLPDPFSSEPGARVYRTGDLARHLPDGTLEFLGRNDFQVKIRGFRIELGEIETALGEHPDVLQCVVTVHEEPGAGKRLVAHVVPRDGADRSSADLSEHLRDRLPEYMLPSFYAFLDELPRTPNGKVDRRALAAPDASLPPAAGRRVAPRNEVERHLARVWERVLDVPDVGVDDDFFELGGHSLLAVRLLNAVRDVFGQDLPLSSLISAPTLGAQAQQLHLGVGGADTNALVKIQTAGTRPPVFCVCSLGGTVLNQRPLAMRLGKDQPFYGLQAVDLEARLSRFARIEDYATHYVELMRAVTPEGPFVVGGHSFGGVVSFEIARQLVERGLEVRMLFILDSALPNLGPSRLGDRVGSLCAFLRGLPHAPAEVLDRLRRDPEQLRRDLRQKLRFLSARWGGAPKRDLGSAELFLYDRNAGLRPEDIVEMSHWPENNRRIAERHYRAVLEYEPRPYPGRVTLFRSRLQSPFLGLGRRMGWERVAQSGVDVYPVPGGHLTLLAPPHVDHLARAMRKALRDVVARRRRSA